MTNKNFLQLLNRREINRSITDYSRVSAEVESGDKIVHAWANDCGLSTCATYRKNICPAAPDSVICCDVRDLYLNSLNKIDAPTFGFPCNDFSIIGKQRGLASANSGSAQKQILRGFHEADYKIFPHLYKFEEYGIPQTRHRIIVVGIRNGIDKNFRPPSPTPYDKNISSRHALECPPIPESNRVKKNSPHEFFIG